MQLTFVAFGDAPINADVQRVIAISNSDNGILQVQTVAISGPVHSRLSAVPTQPCLALTKSAIESDLQAGGPSQRLRNPDRPTATSLLMRLLRLPEWGATCASFRVPVSREMPSVTVVSIPTPVSASPSQQYDHESSHLQQFTLIAVGIIDTS
jgi:hypothetical protein